MNVVLIVSDTFRRDHVGCYGNPWIRSPHLDRFAQGAIVFDNAFASSFPTVPARADLMTGRHTFSYLGWSPLPRTETTLAGLMTAAGYRTFGVADTPFVLRHGYGYDHGFSDFHWVRGQAYGPSRDNVTSGWTYESDYFAPTTLRIAEEWLERHYRDKFFLYVDTWDPHEPWQPPKHYVELYDAQYADDISAHPTYWDWREAGFSQRDIELAHTHYCAEVTMVDRAVGRLLDRIESLDLLGNTAIIFLSDHGFYFGEHGLWGKGRFKSELGYYLGPAKGSAASTLMYRLENSEEIVSDVKGEWYRSPLYDEVTRIPLLLYLPGADAGRIDALVSLPDVMPTILDLVGIEAPDRVQADSLTGLIDGTVDAIHDFVVTSWPMYVAGQRIRVVDDEERRMRENQPSTVTRKDWALLYSVAGEEVELYDRNADPKLKNNVYSQNINIAAEMHGQLLGFLQSLGTDEVYLKPRRSLS
ncbi:MAG: sulfatase [Chloroflexota bacterium]|nr:sulfatase [Chloroflexota bacterium]